MTDALANGFDFPAATDPAQVWSKDENCALSLALALVTLWLGSIVTFGVAGLIFPALAMVATVFVALITISQG